MVAKEGVIVIRFWVCFALYKKCPRALHLSLIPLFIIESIPYFTVDLQLVINDLVLLKG